MKAAPGVKAGHRSLSGLDGDLCQGWTPISVKADGDPCQGWTPSLLKEQLRFSLIVFDNNKEVPEWCHYADSMQGFCGHCETGSSAVQ